MSLFGTSWEDPKTAAVMGLAGGLLQGNAGAGLQQGLLGYQRQAQINNQTARQSKMDAREDEQYAHQQKLEADHEAIRTRLREQFAKMDPRFAGMNGPTPSAAAAMGQVDPEQMVAYELAQADPIKYGGAFASSLKPKAADMKVVGDTLLAIQGGKVEEVWKKPKDVDWNQLMIPGPDGKPVLNTALFDAKRQLAAVGAPKTTVQNINTQESEQSKVYGKALGESRAAITQAGFQAPSTLTKLDRMEQLLAGVDGGKLAPTAAQIASAAKSFGVTIDPRLGDKEAAEALAVEMALAQRPVGSGPMTDKDFDNFLNTVPGLSKTAEGRKQITATLRAKAKRDIQISQKAREYAKQNNGVIDDNFFDQVPQFIAETPVIPQAPQGGAGGLTIRRVR